MRNLRFGYFVFLTAFAIGLIAVFGGWKDKEVPPPTASVAPQSAAPEKTLVIEDLIPQKIFNQNGEEIFWQGASGGFQIQWTEKDIYVQKNGKTKKIYSDYANFLFRRNLPFLKRIKNYCSYSPDARILSIIGRIMTVEIDEMTLCLPATHPNDEVHWIVFDLNDPSAVKVLNKTPYSLKLTDFFSDKEILEAMLENKEIKDALAETAPEYKPKTARELAKWFREKDESWSKLDNPTYSKDTVTFGYKGQLNENSLRSFNFTKSDENHVFVDIGLTPLSRSHDLPTLELRLIIPEKLRKPLELVESEEEFFKDVNGFTRKEFETGKKYKAQIEY